MDTYAPEAVKSLHHLGVGLRADPTRKPHENPGLVKEPGRADLLCGYHGRAFYVEIKDAGKDATSFSFSRYEPHQHEWARKYALHPDFGVPLWVWLCFGQDRPNANVEKFNPRKTWLIPYPEYIKVQDMVSPHQNSLPYRATKGFSRVLQDNKWDALHLLCDWELTWAGNGLWLINPTHKFHRQYIAAPSLPLYGD